MAHLRKTPPVAVFDLAPLVDIVFLLVIFFMVTSTFIKNPGIGVNLPKSKTSDAAPKQDIVITIDSKGQVYVDETAMDQDELGRYIKRSITKDPTRAVIIRGDRTIHYAKLIEVMDIAKLAGVTRLNLATESR